MRVGRLAVVLVVVMALTGCAAEDNAKTGADDGQVRIAASFYPLQWLAQRVGGEAVQVDSVTPPGAEPHEVSIDAKSLQELRNADVVLYIGGDFQPEIERAVDGLSGDVVRSDMLEVSGIELIGDRDPHVWLDPVRMQRMAEQVATSIKHVAPSRAAAIDENLRRVSADLAALDREMQSKLSHCAGSTIVTSHAAFAYLAQRHDLRQLSIAGISPEEEPSPKVLQQIATAAKDAGVRTIYFEEALPADLSRTVASEIGAEIDVLSTAEFDPSHEDGSGDYLSLQRDNAERLAKGLACSR